MKNLSSIVVCSLGVFLGFSNPVWWSIALGCGCALGVIANIWIMIEEAIK